MSFKFVNLRTPLQNVDGIWVKRDDLCCNNPSLAKIRGLADYVASRADTQVFGILDGRHSRNGWALARVCAELGRRCVVYWPRKKAELGLNLADVEGPSRAAARALGAESVPIQAGRSAVVYAAARNHLRVSYGAKAQMVPNAVKIVESVAAHAAEVLAQQRTWKQMLPRSIVVPVGTGTILAGIMLGFQRELGLDPHFIGVLGYSCNEKRLRSYLSSYSALASPKQLTLIDGGYSYGSIEPRPAPFPCCEHYERKAWWWLQESQTIVGRPVVFWNSGS